MCLQPKTSNLTGKPPYRSLTFTQECTFQWKNPFGSYYKNYSSHAGQVKRKVGCRELSVEVTLLGLPHIVKAASETSPNPHVKVDSTLPRSFQQEPY